MAPATVKKLPKGFEKQIIELEYVLDRLGQSLTTSQLGQGQSPTEIITKLVALYSVSHWSHVECRREWSTMTARAT